MQFTTLVKNNSEKLVFTGSGAAFLRQAR